VKLKAYMRNRELRMACQLAHAHGRIVGASEDGTLDDCPEWVRWPEKPLNLLQLKREMGQAWMNGFLEGGEKWLT